MIFFGLQFKKIESNDETKSNIFYSKSTTGTSVNEIDIDDVFWINLYYDYIKHRKISYKRFGLDYWFSHRS